VSAQVLCCIAMHNIPVKHVMCTDSAGVCAGRTVQGRLVVGSVARLSQAVDTHDPLRHKVDVNAIRSFNRE
jgi:hypothetical protein